MEILAEIKYGNRVPNHRHIVHVVVRWFNFKIVMVDLQTTTFNPLPDFPCPSYSTGYLTTYISSLQFAGLGSLCPALI